jgi:hypothetical protein
MVQSAGQRLAPGDRHRAVFQASQSRAGRNFS